jgi:hypothetical protein
MCKTILKQMALIAILSVSANALAANVENDLRTLCAKVSQNETAHIISLEEAANILFKEGYHISDVEDDNFKIKINGRTLVMFRFDDGDFQLYYGSTGIKVDYKVINDWNRDKRLSRAYIDRVGDPVIESDLLGDAGLTAQQLINFTKTFADITVPQFRQFIIENGR